MKRVKSLFLVLSMSLPLYGGCLTNLLDWDLTACEGNLGTCLELFWDNQDQILGGSDIIDIALESAE